jgi:hypothetical protein
MKRLMVALILGFFLVPVSAWGQKWIESYTAKDGTWVEGHWQTPDEVRQKGYSTPGKVNPYSGQFTPYTDTLKSTTPPAYDPFIPQDYPRDYRYRNR